MQAMSSNPLQFHSAQADPRITLQRSSNRFSARPSSYDEIVLKRGIDQPGSIRSLKYAGGWTRPCTRAYDYPPESRAKCRIRFALQTFARIFGQHPTSSDSRRKVYGGGCPWHVHMTLFRGVTVLMKQYTEYVNGRRVVTILPANSHPPRITLKHK